jgi:hypothetical protein
LIRLLADFPIKVVARKLGRSIDACRQRYRRKGYSLTGIAETRMTAEQRTEWGISAKARLRNYGISQKSVAEIYGCGCHFLCSAMSGKMSLTGETAQKIEHAIEAARIAAE